jgi:hypothetical protein
LELKFIKGLEKTGVLASLFYQFGFGLQAEFGKAINEIIHKLEAKDAYGFK